jgi:mannitol/fructose-specific phosphotransferase system IIA component (Ntr-type)
MANYSDEQIQFIIKNRNINKLSWSEITERFNKKFNENKNIDAMRKTFERYQNIDFSKDTFINNAKKTFITKKNNSYITLDDANMDYQEFLEWNKQQKTPLDLKSTIAVKAQAQPTQAELLSELNRLIDSAQAIETILKK